MTHVRHALACASSIVAIVLACLALPAQAGVVVMHGYADYTSATLWVQTEGPATIALEVRGEDSVAPRRFALEATQRTDYTASLRVPGLSPGRTYAYRLTAGDETREGVLRTQRFAARPQQAPQLAIAFGSCHFMPYPDPAFTANVGGDYQIFDAIASKSPDLMLWLGDNLYLQRPDFTDPTSMAAHYRQVRAFEPLQRLLTSTAHLAIWDDHDYGPNDSDRSYVFKDQTLGLFQRYWPNPSFGLPGVPGIFGWVHLADVDLFLLDDRFHRYPNRYPNVPEKSMFGAPQFEWLKEALLSSTARIKVVANGSQMWNRASRFEGLHQFPDEQKRLAQWLVEQKIDGVVFLSGDRHFGELLRIERAGTYPVYEFTSSPLTYRAAENLDATERNNPDVVQGTLRTQRQFGMLRVTGPSNARMLAFESYDSNGTLLWRHAIAAADIRNARPPAGGER
ncbi:MAG: alkaline phosphatase D family protein [Pseudomonadota bacterium]|nr:alkaline phosphatase D family protein [Pseudomonadota bacterium]